ncbi:MAG: hypothetical protein H6Q74_3203 [Firmicutes bacterium]|nr:hypothetical protein [Bacillota bacterium]
MSKEISISEQATLDVVVELAKEYPRLKIKLTGYVDDLNKYNRVATYQRIKTVQSYLLRQGISFDRLASVTKARRD